MLVLCLSRLLAAQEAAPAWTMSDSERLAIDAVVERAIAAGLPEARGGALFQGLLRVKPADAAASPLSAAPQRPRMVASYQGLHLKRADGTWLAGLGMPLRISAGMAIDPSALRPVGVATLLADSVKEARQRGWDPDYRDPDWYAHHAPEQRPMLEATTRFMPVQQLIYSTGHPAVATAQLIRLGMPESELLVVALANQLLWKKSTGSLCTGAATRLFLLPADEQAEMASRQAGFRTATGLRVPELATSFRRELAISFFMDLITPPTPPAEALDPATATALVRALLAEEPGLPALNAELAALPARNALPMTLPVGAELTLRVATWGDQTNVYPLAPATGTAMTAADENSPVTKVDQEDLEVDGQEGSVRHHAPLATSPRFTAADLDGLVALLGTHRPSRWVDGWGRLRTVGDNALRAMALLIGCDPRLLIGRDPATAWNADESAATATALAAWWPAHRTETPDALFVGALARIPLGEVAQHLGAAAAGERTALLDRLAQIWSDGPPASPEPAALATVLAAADDHSALGAAVVRWPVVGPTDLVLVTWRLCARGDGAPFDALLAATLADPTAEGGADADHATRLSALLAIAYLNPTAGRLQSVVAAFAQPPGTPPGQNLFHAFARAAWNGGRDELGPLLERGDADAEQRGKAATAMPLALFAVLLRDQRPAPPTLAATYAPWGESQRQRTSAKPAAALPRAGDLRICDLAGMVLGQQLYYLHLDKLITDQEQVRNAFEGAALDPADELPARDQALVARRRLILAALPPALAAAGLPAVLPGITDAPQAGDAQAAF